ncbi:hypothetical protein [Nonomuraea dietziae]|uniref:Uncharacterized protein n=1 Tax=Nonomuraea dietziae TaxID=65515 RepID=A0A7W5VLX8_9ACTN|nr:hypothetical protein [Nonomuraea dietziae]MBB3733825.1 hypothetical protein [Nonomuraea dietziae]
MDTPRPDGGGRHQWIRTGLAAVRFVLWLGWLIWVSIDDYDATR